jgi:hypothetical protein
MYSSPLLCSIPVIWESLNDNIRGDEWDKWLAAIKASCYWSNDHNFDITFWQLIGQRYWIIENVIYSISHIGHEEWERIKRCTMSFSIFWRWNHCHQPIVLKPREFVVAWLNPTRRAAILLRTSETIRNWECIWHESCRFHWHKLYRDILVLCFFLDIVFPIHWKRSPAQADVLRFDSVW